MRREEQYIKGFNSGYYIAKYETSLANKLVCDIANGNSFFVGFSDGRLEVINEKAKNELYQLQFIRKNGKDLDRSDFKDLLK